MELRSRAALFAPLFLVVLLVVLGQSEAVSRSIPPLFRETPNARSNNIIRADDNVNYRLPNNTEPVHYDVQLTTNVHTGEKAFTGTVKIDLKVLADTKTIVLHARQLSNFVASVKSKESATPVSQPMTIDYEQDREFLSLTPTNAALTFPKNSIWELTIAYTGELRTDNGGFYISTYTDNANVVHYLATTQFESTNARHAFPCYDEPAKRATFRITIKHNPAYKAISNMPEDETASKQGETVFQTTGKMSTYLVAFIVSDFKWTSGELNSLTQRVFSRPGTQHDQEFALVSGMLIVERLAEYYGVNFAFPKLDQVAVPDFNAGAMENWGLVTYREEYLLYNKARSTVNTQTSIANIIGHEYAHQWFGNYVAIKWWSYLWLKEGFATLFSYIATDEAYPEWGVFQMFHSDDYIRALNSDGFSNARPMSYYVQKPTQISALYDSVSYSKAGCVLLMWQHALTDTVFQRGLHNYLVINQFSSAEEGDLFNAIQIAATEENYSLPATITEMMSSWTQQGGVPLLTVERNYKDSTFVVKQEAFVNDESTKPNKTWFVPFNFVTKTNSDFRDTEASHYLLNETQLLVNHSLVLNKDWLILNKQSTGYYRINYDVRNWQLITEGLITSPHKIHPRNRAQLLNDAYTFSTTNHLSHSILLNLMTYLRKEDQYAPWSSANGIISTFNRYLSGDSEYHQFLTFVQLLVGDIYEKLGVNDIPGEQHFQKYTRSLVINLACLAGIKSCLEDTNNKLKSFIDEGIEIEPNLESITYCNGLKQSGEKEFDFTYNQLMNSVDQARKRSLISSLGCAQKEAQIKKFVESSIDTTNSLRPTDRSTLLRSAYSRGSVGLLTSIEFLNNNWEEYANLPTGFSETNPLDDDIRGMSSYVVNKEQEQKLLDLVTKVKNSEKVTKTLEEAVKSNIVSNYAWLKANRNPVINWVSNFQRSGSATVTASTMSIAVAALLVVSRLL